MSWTQLFGRTDLIGGDVEIQEGSTLITRGPLVRMEERDGAIHFHLAWCAHQDIQTRQWRMLENKPVSINRRAWLCEAEGDTVLIRVSGLIFILFPKGHKDQLDPQEVIDLPPRSQRLLALYPKLAFDRSAAEQVCRDKGATLTLPKVSALPDNATLQDLLGLFTPDQKAEEFLWYYIERFTGETKVHQQVY